MKLEDGKIIEMTEKELENYWFQQSMFYLYPFSEFCQAMKNCGVHILDWKARPPTTCC